MKLYSIFIIISCLIRKCKLNRSYADKRMKHWRILYNVWRWVMLRNASCLRWMDRQWERLNIVETFKGENPSHVFIEKGNFFVINLITQFQSCFYAEFPRCSLFMKKPVMRFSANIYRLIKYRSLFETFLAWKFMKLACCWQSQSRYQLICRRSWKKLHNERNCLTL